jgi:hypothetical protein
MDHVVEQGVILLKHRRIAVCSPPPSCSRPCARRSPSRRWGSPGCSAGAPR